MRQLVLRLMLLTTLFQALAICAFAEGSKDKLTAKDKSAILATLDHYRTAWLASNADGVRSVFTKDAVLMPHHGVAPVVGMEAINEFWWPKTTVKTTITKFTQTVDETGGGPELAYVRGRSEVAWTMEDHDKVEKWRNGSNFLALLVKQADGRWLISHLIWNDPPNQRVN